MLALLRPLFLLVILLFHISSSVVRNIHTWVCKWYRRPWSVSEIMADRRDREDGKRSACADDDGVEDGWLLDGGPMEVFQRLLEEAWDGHCDLGRPGLAVVGFRCARSPIEG